LLCRKKKGFKRLSKRILRIIEAIHDFNIDKAHYAEQVVLKLLLQSPTNTQNWIAFPAKKGKSLH
jgi:hypothetical protein